MANREYLESWERDVVSFIERYHAVSGVAPEDNEIIEYVNSFSEANNTDISQDDLDALKGDFLFKESMRVRGIILDTSNLAKNLTPKQMAAVASMLNLIDKRSDEKKLRDLGITAEEWGTWMQNDKFAAYVTGRAEKLIANSTHEAHMGLMKAIRGGNTKAIELHYKLTGRFDPDKDAELNVRVILGRVLEVIQRHVKDPNTLNALGADLMQVGIESSAHVPQVGPQVIKQLRP